MNKFARFVTRDVIAFEKKTFRPFKVLLCLDCFNFFKISIFFYFASNIHIFLKIVSIQYDEFVLLKYFYKRIFSLYLYHGSNKNIIRIKIIVNKYNNKNL